MSSRKNALPFGEQGTPANAEGAVKIDIPDAAKRHSTPFDFSFVRRWCVEAKLDPSKASQLRVVTCDDKKLRNDKLASY